MPRRLRQMETPRTAGAHLSIMPKITATAISDTESPSREGPLLMTIRWSMPFCVYSEPRFRHFQALRVRNFPIPRLPSWEDTSSDDRWTVQAGCALRGGHGGAWGGAGAAGTIVRARC